MDPEDTIDLIEKMKAAKIGDHARWKRLAKKIRNRQELNGEEIRYFSTFTRTYKSARVTPRSRILHVRLSEEDRKPGCQTCGEESEFYCNQNDAYFCKAHIVGHDRNER